MVFIAKTKYYVPPPWNGLTQQYRDPGKRVERRSVPTHCQMTISCPDTHTHDAPVALCAYVCVLYYTILYSASRCFALTRISCFCFDFVFRFALFVHNSIGKLEILNSSLHMKELLGFFI